MITELQMNNSPFGLFASDASVGARLARLDQSKRTGVGAQDLLDLVKAASDYGQLTRGEWANIHDWVQKNSQHLSADAHQLFAKLDQVIQERGGGSPTAGDRISQRMRGTAGATALNGPELENVLAELERMAAGPEASVPVSVPAGSPSSPPASSPVIADRIVANASAGRDDTADMAIERLMNQGGRITGAQLMNAILDGVSDPDGQAAGTELQAFLEFARSDGHRFHGTAATVMAIYEKYANAARAEGHQGIAADQADLMRAEMGEAVRHTVRAGIASLSPPDVADRAARTTAATAETADKETRAATKEPAKTSKTSSAAKAGKAGDDLAGQAMQAAQAVSDLQDEIGRLDPESPTYHKDLLALQVKLHRAQEALQLLTQMLKNVHEMSMEVIRNIRV